MTGACGMPLWPMTVCRWALQVLWNGPLQREDKPWPEISFYFSFLGPKLGITGYNSVILFLRQLSRLLRWCFIGPLALTPDWRLVILR
jgi:hypothetical protein